MNTYTSKFYSSRHETTLYTADTILSLLLKHLPAISSAVDIGCGVGTWLSVLKEKGVNDIQGVDGNWVDPDLFEIPKDSFQQIDLNNGLQLTGSYDLAICLEVAEHLPHEKAQDFIQSLTGLSDFVLFSAAIPFQGGNNHVNEQWHDYWVDLFSACHYERYDFIRAKIWNDDRIPFWYRQNIMLFVKNDRKSDIRIESAGSNGDAFPLCVVHPELYSAVVDMIPPPKYGFKDFKQSVKNHLKLILGRA